MSEKVLFGVNYGSKLSGNTLIAIYKDSSIVFMDVDKGVDADGFILKAASHFNPSYVFLNVPLSLPGIYHKIDGCDDYHFRKADKDLNSISPMFNGGLAARAMELKAELENIGSEVFETCPRILAKRFGFPAKGYQGSNQGLKCCRTQLTECFKDTIAIKPSDIKSWYHLDALLILMSAMNFEQGCADAYGNKEEGLIFI